MTSTERTTAVTYTASSAEASSMIGTGVSPSDIGLSAAGGVVVGLSALAVRSGRRRTTLGSVGHTG